MFKNILPLAAAVMLSLFAVTGLAGAGESNHTNLGPVGPYEPILTTVGKSRLVAYYEPDDGRCAVSVVMSDDGGVKPMRVRVVLHPGELFHLDSVADERVVITCAPNARGMAVLNKGEILTRSASNVLY
ncbi:hypothetical protein AUC68_11070 [Methyloceanibacter methanicus]|uniref:Uncharacterized protein n=1 Tax=Methyloceanibacter methanicus TaxID=1774968 RepID=A0A1E3VWX8_9HYPH|nr:hypothetical protein [Methyloceanibacter methanicus]ODR98037.1 hypothetical protein AUC68_11070 [Methyloceanibacter methanicus]